MNRAEALHILGLDEDATEEDVKAAYKETVQILHPDRFAGNKKLQDRATEQFKNLQEAYDVLTDGSAESGRTRSRRSGGYSRAAELEARLAGITAAREQLVAQRDASLDRRRNGFTFVGVGLLAALFLRRIPAIAAIAGAAVVWGIVDIFSATGDISALDSQLGRLKKEKQEILEELEELEYGE